MPASMIRAPTGGRPKVIGSSIATVAMVPMPGSTPTNVPTSAPTRQSSKLIGLKATAKPCARFWNRSSMPASLHQKTWKQRHRQPEHVRKQQRAAQGQDDAHDERLAPARFGCTERGDQEARERRDDQPQGADRHGKAQDRERHE